MTIMTGYNDTAFLLAAQEKPYGRGLSLLLTLATLLLSVLQARPISARRWIV